MADTLIKGFPQSDGGKIESVIDHTGPASYTQVSTGTSPTGGDQVSAATFGMKYIEELTATMDNTGVYIPLAFKSGTDALGAATWILRWFTAATMAEVAGATNLSASHVRLHAIGV